MLDAGKCMEIYEYCQRQWEKLARKDGHYNPSKHDRVVFGMAAKEFRISEATVQKACDLVVRVSGKSAAKGCMKEGVEEILRKLLFNNTRLQIK